MKAMQDWYSVWSRKLGGNDSLARWGLGGEDVHGDVARYWHKRAKNEAQGTVIERRYYDDEGDEVVDLYAHKSLIFLGVGDDIYSSVAVFESGGIERIEAFEVSAFWMRRADTFLLQAKASSTEAVRLWKGIVFVHRWLVEAHRFEASVHRLDRN